MPSGQLDSDALGTHIHVFVDWLGGFVASGLNTLPAIPQKTGALENCSGFQGKHDLNRFSYAPRVSAWGGLPIHEQPWAVRGLSKPASACRARRNTDIAPSMADLGFDRASYEQIAMPAS